MNKSEKLMLEYDDLNFFVRNDMPNTISGLILGTTVYLNNQLSEKELIATVAEEIDITDYTHRNNRKNETVARRWSYKKLIPLHKLKKCKHTEEQVMVYDISVELDLPEDIVKEAIDMYKVEGKI